MTLFSKTIRGAAWSASLAALLAMFTVQLAAARDFHGAIAFSQTTGAIGWSYDFHTRDAAEQRAIKECKKHGSGCRVATWFKNACGALAVGGGNAFGGAWGTTRYHAEAKALTLCSDKSKSCTVRRWVCTGEK